MKYFAFLLPIVLLLSACAQSKKTIHNSYAFFKQTLPGVELSTIDMDGNVVKNSIDTIRMVFIETKGGTTPTVDTVIINHKTYKATVYPVSGDKYLAGKKKDDTPVILEASKNKAWWLLQFHSPETSAVVPKPGWIIFIKGYFNNQEFNLYIDKETELKPDIRM